MPKVPNLPFQQRAFHGRTVGSVLGKGAEVITVGPVGAHFTTLSAAIDAATEQHIASANAEQLAVLDIAAHDASPKDA